ncbi:hypothetical protein GKC30_05770 [Pseudodesulfovibrio sp. F-1]|uniref:Uncharacterized protein n=1 Tax=Pseudodesulfovibrio alkaliphilus TaxID=2661613 RepID=A0A7K1KM42_9BACT|nr:hypothetical protein [Pseudodesulfovibrio alkaliphilus]MUM77135.1 hypothetical protein [Pseudodesulfovibrio alkaliphilus]
MKDSVRAVLRKAAIICILAGTVCLPGCAVVGPLLSVGGLAGLAPLQYASTAYTLGEFTYEYAANGKDPGEVVRAKVDGFVSGEAFALPGSSEMPDSRQGYDAPSPMPDNMLATRSRVRPGESQARQADPDGMETMAVLAASGGADATAQSLSDEARQQRVEQLLGRRSVQYERLETRRMLFGQAHARGQLSLRQTAMASAPNLVIGAMGETTLRQ